MAIWGIDLGGTKIEGIIMPSLEDVNPILRMRIDTEAQKGYQHILGQIALLIEKMKAASGLSPNKIGIGTPGVLDPVLQTMKNCNSTALNGQSLQKDLEKRLEIPVILANDANCFALAETHWGVIKQKNIPAQIVFGIIIGTGVGGGIVINGKIWNGHHGIGGEWGHNYLDESGGDCYCGKKGCVETVIAGPSLERYYQTISGQQKRLKEISEITDIDEYAEKTMERLYDNFGKAVSSVINILDPDVIVIGGGVGNIDTLYSKGVEKIHKYIFNNRVDVPILKPVLGDSAGVFGAAALAE